MKRTINSLFLFIILLSFSAQAQSVGTNLKDNQGRKTGVWKGYYPNGSLRYEGQFEEGKPTGIFKFFFNTGEIKSIMKYRSPLEAYVIHYYSTGDKMAEGKYKNKLKDSIWTTYGAKNIKVDEGPYVKGQKFGLWKTFHVNGKVAEEGFMDKDLEQDTFKSYFISGGLQQVMVYVDGFLNGETTYYDEKGRIILRGLYANGKRDKRWIYYTENFKVKKRLIYDKGKLTNPEVLEELELDTEEFQRNRKDRLDFDDFRGKIKYE